MRTPTVTEGDRTVISAVLSILFVLCLLVLVLLLLRPILPSRLQSLLAALNPPPAEQTAPTPIAPPASPAPSTPIAPELPAASPAPEVPAVPDVSSVSPAPEAPPLPSPPPEAATETVPLPAPTSSQPPPPPSAPHFRNICWGMSPDEVRAAEAPLTPLRSTDASITYAASTLDRPCLLAYAFRDGRLTAARLQFSLPASTHVPALAPDAARAAYDWLRTQLIARYGIPTSQKYDNQPRDTAALSDQAQKAREEAETCATTLAAARKRLADRTAALRKKYQNWPEATARIDQELSSERRYVADLEARVADLKATERSALSSINQSHINDTLSPLHARDSATWAQRFHQHSPHIITLSADYTTTPARLEIHYQSVPHYPDAANGL